MCFRFSGSSDALALLPCVQIAEAMTAAAVELDKAGVEALQQTPSDTRTGGDGNSGSSDTGNRTDHSHSHSQPSGLLSVSKEIHRGNHSAAFRLTAVDCETSTDHATCAILKYWGPQGLGPTLRWATAAWQLQHGGFARRSTSDGAVPSVQPIQL